MPSIDLYVVAIPTENQVTAAATLAEVSTSFGHKIDRKGAYNAMRFLLPPLLVGTTDDHDALLAAQEALEGVGFLCATLEAGSDPAPLRTDEDAPAIPDDDDEPVADPVLVAQTALAFMAFADGAASGAVSFLATMEHIDPDGPYRAAIQLMFETFPPQDSQITVAKMIVDAVEDDDDDG